MKKLISFLLLISILLSVTACGRDTESNSPNDGNTYTNGAPSRSDDDDWLEGAPAGEINVSCYDSFMHKNFLEEAAKAFEAKYPGTKVNINSFSVAPDVKTSNSQGGKNMQMVTNSLDTKSQNDYINQISTELMTGGGPDVLAMDILPYYKYAENGQLDDLNEYMEKDEGFNKDEYRQNILDAVSYKGGQYIMPIDYTFNFIGFDKALLNPEDQNKIETDDTYTYEELADIGTESFEEYNDKNPDVPLKMFSLSGGSGVNSFFNMLLNMNYDSFVNIEDKTVNFTDGGFADILNKSKEYEERGYLDIPVQKGSPDMLKRNTSQEFLFKNIRETMLLEAFNDGTAPKAVININGGGMFSENDSIGGMLKNDDNKISFDFTQAYGINSNSDNKKTAWEFVKFLVSEEMQTSLNILGRPVNNNANEEKAKLQITGEFFPNDINSEASVLNEKQNEIFKNYMKSLEQYSDMLNNYMLCDTIVDEMINSEVKYFFDGSKSSEEVAEILQSKVEIYLNE